MKIFLSTILKGHILTSFPPAPPPLATDTQRLGPALHPGGPVLPEPPPRLPPPARLGLHRHGRRRRHPPHAEHPVDRPGRAGRVRVRALPRDQRQTAVEPRRLLPRDARADLPVRGGRPALPPRRVHDHAPRRPGRDDASPGRERQGLPGSVHEAVLDRRRAGPRDEERARRDLFLQEPGSRAGILGARRHRAEEEEPGRRDPRREPRRTGGQATHRRVPVRGHGPAQALQVHRRRPEQA